MLNFFYSYLLNNFNLNISFFTSNKQFYFLLSSSSSLISFHLSHFIFIIPLYWRQCKNRLVAIWLLIKTELNIAALFESFEKADLYVRKMISRISYRWYLRIHFYSKSKLHHLIKSKLFAFDNQLHNKVI